jgi:Arc/MetJ family transcription regulator
VYIFDELYTSVAAMRTNIEIDDDLMKAAMQATGKTTKKATVEAALRQAVRNTELKQVIADMRGLSWEGDLDDMREGRVFDPLP